MKLPSKRHSYIPLLLSGALVVGAFGGLALYESRLMTPVSQSASRIKQVSHKEQFPDINTSQLNATQQKIVSLLRQEYQAQNKGTKYSDGANEAWCADFVSWIMKEADHPLNNPNSGSWRIPGTYTLREYYQSAGKFRTGDSGYQPKAGDVMLYDYPSTFGQHTNIVVKNVNGVVTTVGGNEPGGIRVYTHTDADKVGLVGYGVL